MELRGLIRGIFSKLNPGKDFMFGARANMFRNSLLVTYEGPNHGGDAASTNHGANVVSKGLTNEGQVNSVLG